MFKFELNQTVTISISGEVGKVIGRAEYANSEPAYFVRFKAADGRAVESWWTQDALS